MDQDLHSEELALGLERCLSGENRMAGFVRRLLDPFVAKKSTTARLPQLESPAMKEGAE